jgi:predicted molibdopterin-dependent oxidoreductase YjgC
MEEISSIVPSYAAVTYSHLERGGIRRPESATSRKRFFPVEFRAPSEKPDEQYPLWIIPKGFHYPYVIGTTTKRLQDWPGSFPVLVWSSSEDARRAGLQERIAKVVSPRGR